MLVNYDGVRVIEGKTVTKSEAMKIAKYSIANFEESKIEFILSKDELNNERDKELEELEISIEKDGAKIILDADKKSQENIKMAVLALNENEETPWITKDNKLIVLTHKDLQLALRKVGEMKSEIIFKYRALKDSL
jgi:hypothetical protein